MKDINHLSEAIRHLGYISDMIYASHRKMPSEAQTPLGEGLNYLGESVKLFEKSLRVLKTKNYERLLQEQEQQEREELSKRRGK